MEQREGDVGQSIAVIGAGTMGAQISQVLATFGFEVRLHDLDDARLTAAVGRIQHGRFGLERGVERAKLTAAQARDALGRITTTTSLEAACAGVDGVLEVVFEDLPLKMALFRRLDRLVGDGVILASNTAGLSIAALAGATERPGRVIGWHWFQPCPVMRLNELVVAPATSAGTIATVSGWAARCGKSARVVRDNPRAWGHVANRLNEAVRAEARRVVEEGLADAETVDAIMREGFAWPMGPFEGQRLPE
jgi:3-hydroxybutyryl-CoA dehydrogenase